VFYSDSSQRRVFPDSEIWRKSQNAKCKGKWIEIKANGECVVNGEILESTKIKMATTTDSDSMTSIITRTDNVMVFEQQNGGRVIQCPDSMHILVESAVKMEDWNGHQLAEWIESIGVERQSAEQIANDKLRENADSIKSQQKSVRFELKNDSLMPTVIVFKEKDEERTECIFYDGFKAIFGRSTTAKLESLSANGCITVEHRGFGTLTFGGDQAVFVPISNEEKESEDPLEYHINLKADNPSISCSETMIALNGEYTGTVLEDKRESQKADGDAICKDEEEQLQAPRTKIEIPEVLGETMDCDTTDTVDQNDEAEDQKDVQVEPAKNDGVEAITTGTRNIDINEDETENNNDDKTGNPNDENTGYFENEPFLMDFEIGCGVNELLANCPPTEGLEIIMTLKALCDRLRAMISMKNRSDATIRNLHLDEVEEMVTEIVAMTTSNNESIEVEVTERLHKLLCSLGLMLDPENECYVMMKCSILIDGGICFMASKLDEFHVDFKKHIKAERIREETMRANGDETSDIGGGTRNGRGIDTVSLNQELDDERYADDGRHGHDDNMQSYSHHTTGQIHRHPPPDLDHEAEKDPMARCLSHCSCCPPQSPLRATRMDYMGRTRDHFISIDDLQKYPAAVPQRKLNRKYIENEGSVERRVRTSSTFNSSLAIQDAAIPTVVIQPAAFDFGDLRIGNVYRFTATITNHGHSQSRFHLSIASHSDPEHPVHIKAYHKMGGIAPGISIALQIELCSETLSGPYSNIVTIKTKKHIFDIEVSAHFVKQRDRNEAATTNKRVVCLGKKY